MMATATYAVALARGRTVQLHLRTWLGGNRYEVTASLGDDEGEPFPGQRMTLWDDMGVVRVVSVDRAPAEVRIFMTSAEIARYRALEVVTTEAVGRLPNRGGTAN